MYKSVRQSFRDDVERQLNSVVMVASIHLDVVFVEYFADSSRVGLGYFFVNSRAGISGVTVQCRGASPYRNLLRTESCIGVRVLKGSLPSRPKKRQRCFPIFQSCMNEFRRGINFPRFRSFAVKNSFIVVKERRFVFCFRARCSVVPGVTSDSRVQDRSVSSPAQSFLFQTEHQQ